MKKSIFAVLFVNIQIVFAQVGIDNSDPKATLDVTAQPSDLSKIDGIIAPRLTGNELKAKDNLYGALQNATFVFATSASVPSTPKTVEVTKPGYYYYDAGLEKWVTFQTSSNSIVNPVNTITTTVNGVSANTTAVNTVANTLTTGNQLVTKVNGVESNPVDIRNIYNNNGTLTDERVMTMAGNRLILRGTLGSTLFSNSFNGATLQHTANSGQSTFALRAGTTGMQFFVNPNSDAQISAGDNATSLVIATSGTPTAAPISFLTSSGSGAAGQKRAEIAGDGRFNILQSLSIGYNVQQTFTGSQRLRVNGSIVTTANTYPDYVFEKYFTGNSLIKPDYHFKNLEETKTFVKENHHLPGIVSIKDLKKSEDGYDVDMTQLSIQQLEKIEELYLHAFEQEEVIRKQQSEITDLRVRLEKIEKALSK